MALPFPSDFQDGELVQCQHCGKNIRVKYYDRDSVVIVSTQEQQTLALRCQYCGYVQCDSCAHPPESILPVCASCHREWGPYYFTRDILTPLFSTVTMLEDAQSNAHHRQTSQSWVSNIPVSPSERLGAGDTDVVRADLARKRWKRIRHVFFSMMVILLVVGAVYIAFGPGKPYFGKALEHLSSQPKRSPTMIILLNNSSIGVTPTKLAPSTPKVLHTNKPSSTMVALTETIMSSQTSTKLIPTVSPSSTVTRVNLTYTPTPAPTYTQPVSPQIGCVPALSVTLDDVGKELCVTGTVVFTTQKGDVFSIYFSKDDGTFRIVIYDRVPKDIVEGVCVQVTNEIQTLLDRPVMALRYHDVINICTP